jgi:hypothetical protein
VKKTGKTLTLSGQMDKRLFNQQLFRSPKTILEYANVLDLNKAWKVKDFRCWVQETGLELGSITENATFGLDVQLSTDDIPNSGDWNNAEENRAIGWGTLSYALSDTYAGKTQAFSGVQRMLLHSEYWMHPDHLIQNKLTISAQSTGANSVIEGLDGYTLNYIVYLEEYDITATESIVFNIKGKAQNVSG